MNSNVLIVDDSAVDRSVLHQIIKKNIPEAIVFESDNGLDMADLLRNHNIKVCLLDLRMPLKDGYDLLCEIKSNPITMDVPVIVCTGILDTESIERILKLGAFDYFTKPLSDEAMKISLPLKVRNAIDLMNRTEYIVHLSRIDALTGLFNRTYFKTFLSETEQVQKLPVSILMCDINGLKVANDAYGSDVGDSFLISAAEIIKRNCPEDAIASRWGGDEFVVILPDTSKNEAERIASKIKGAFNLLMHHGLTLSMACGWDTLTAPIHDLYKVLANAEDAMFRDKILEDVSVRSSMIATILNTLHEKNPREEAHSRRVSELCMKMGEVLCFSEKEIHELKIVGLLHDIGKIAIDEHILNKPGHLEHEEWLEIRRHPEIGFRLLSASSEMQIYADAILCHHERYDGKGYPNGIKAEEIPIQARILSIVDSYDAMTCERTYKTVMDDIAASNEIAKHAGKQFDYALAKTFVENVLGLEGIFQKGCEFIDEDTN